MGAPDARTARVPAEPNADGSNENAAILAPVDDARKKRLITLKAQFALHGGHAVHELASGGFLVVATRWGGMSRECPDLSALAAFARQLGIRA
jgi:hypothetical protein